MARRLTKMVFLPRARHISSGMPIQILRSHHRTTVCRSNPIPRVFLSSDSRTKPKTTALIVKPEIFDKIPDTEKSKQNFIAICRAFNIARKNDLYKAGHVDFVRKALEVMDKYSVGKDIDSYNALIDCFPKEVMVPENRIQAAFHHFPRQQDCCLRLLNKMSENGLMPDKRTYMYVRDSFGVETHPMRKLERMMYWHPKFLNADPYDKDLPTVKEGLPDDLMLLAVLAMNKMCVDKMNKITVHKTKDIPDSRDDTFIVSAQAPEQKRLIERLKEKAPVYVSGPYTVWLRWKSVTYFTLTFEYTGDWPQPYQIPDIQEHYEDVRDWPIPSTPASSGMRGGEVSPVRRSLHEQSDGVMLAMCVTGTDSLDSLRSWVKMLQVDNPRLGSLSVLFRVTSHHAELAVRKRELERPRRGVPTKRLPTILE